MGQTWIVVAVFKRALPDSTIATVLTEFVDEESARVKYNQLCASGECREAHLGTVMSTYRDLVATDPTSP